MKYKLELFPYSLIRISGGSMDELNALNAVKTCEVLDSIYEIREKINRVKNSVNDALYAHISAQTDSNVQKQLLNLKRDIFNEREVGKANVEEVKNNLTPSVAADIETYFSLRTQYSALRKTGETVFNSERESLHQNLKKLFSNETLQKGLLLSSQTLLDRVSSYLEKDSADMRKKEAQTEQGLIKYITRMHAKTSPFSTFTNLSVGKAQDVGGAGLLQTSKISKDNVVSHIRLNNFLYQYIKTLLIKNKNIYQWLLLRPNPTIQNKGDHFLYLTNNNNLEAFQRIPFSAVVDLFRELTSKNKQGIGYQELIDLIIKEEYIDAGKEELETYINQLIEYGFFEFNIGVSGIDTEWDKRLVEKIKPISSQNPLLEELIEALEKMRELAMDYGKASLDRRKTILEEAFNCFRGVCMKLHEAAGLPAEERRPKEEIEKEWRKKVEEEKAKVEQKKKEEEERKKRTDPAPVEEPKKEEEKKEDVVFKHTSSTAFIFKPEQLFYEDTAIDVEFKLSYENLKNFTAKVDDVISQVVLFEGYHDERQRLKHFFNYKYGVGKQVDLLTFYEDYFREFKKEEAGFYDQKNKENRKIAEEYKEKEKELETKPEEIEKLKKELAEKTKVEVPEKFKVKSIEARSEKMKQWNELLDKENDSKNSNDPHQNIKININPFRAVNAKMDLSEIDTNVQGSYGMFVQLYEEKAADGTVKLMGVLNSTFPGYGKLVSRFLHIFDSSFTEEIRKWNLSLQDNNSIFIEDCDASYFNANLHPPLMPGEVWMPNGHNSLPADKQIPVTDLSVVSKEGSYNLTLIQVSTGKEINVFDLGFQGHGGRSQLFQLLDKFSKAKMLSWHPVLNLASKKEEPKKDTAGISMPEDTGKQEADKKDQQVQKPKKQITVRPRIIMDEQLVIQRKGWFVPKELLLLRKNTETDWDYFERVNIWRTENKMPDEVFVVIYSQNQRFENEEQAKGASKIGRDDYKPQYINFTNPYLVNLFEKLLIKVPVSLRIDEMLPNSRQLFKFGDQRHIAEFVVQWYKYEK